MGHCRRRLATGIGQAASFILCAVYFFKPRSFRLNHKSFIPDFSVLRSTVLLGAATFVTQISIVVMSLTSNIVLAKYGTLSIYGQDIPISVFSIQTKVYTVVLSLVTGVVLGGSRFSAITTVQVKSAVYRKPIAW